MRITQMQATDLGLDPKKYEVDEGCYSHIMPLLIDAGFVPWSPADIISQRNASIGKIFQFPLWGNYFDTDSEIVGTQKEVYVLPRSPRLRTITPQSKLVNGGLPLTLDDLPVRVKTYRRNEQIFDKLLTEDEARRHPFWLDLAEGKQELLDTFVENTFSLGKDQHGRETMMGIQISEDSVGRPLKLYWLGYGARAARGSLDCNYFARLISVRDTGSTLESQV